MYVIRDSHICVHLDQVPPSGFWFDLIMLLAVNLILLSKVDDDIKHNQSVDGFVFIRVLLISLYIRRLRALHCEAGPEKDLFLAVLRAAAHLSLHSGSRVHLRNGMDSCARVKVSE